jgi:hypothetical protein
MHQHIIACERARPIGREFSASDQELDTVSDNVGRATQADIVSEAIVARAEMNITGTVQIDPAWIITG